MSKPVTSCPAAAKPSTAVKRSLKSAAIPLAMAGLLNPLIAGAAMGVTVRVASPAGYEPGPDVVATARATAAGGAVV